MTNTPAELTAEYEQIIDDLSCGPGLVTVDEMLKRLESLLLVLYFECEANNGSELSADQMCNLFEQALSWIRLGQHALKYEQEVKS